RASEVVGYWPALISRERVRQRVIVGEREVDVPQPDLSKATAKPFKAPGVYGRTWHGARTTRLPLSRLCLARSGDKGDTANIGVIARSDLVYVWMLDNLT